MKNKALITIGAILLGFLFIIACGSGGSSTFPIGLLSRLTTGLDKLKLSLSEKKYDFGGVVVNNNADREFTITNTGTEAGLAISSISSDTSEFNITSENCTSQSLGSSATCTFVARFSPKVQGAFKGNISVTSNDWPTTTIITLTGAGYGLNVWINQADFSDCSDVKLDVTATDINGPVSSLNTENFILWQNNRKQTITSVSTIYNSDPVSVVIALDLSSSLTSSLTNIRTNAKYFIEQLGDTDEVAIFKFKKDILFYPSSLFVSTDAAGKIDLENHIDPPDPVIEETALYDAVFDSITRAATGTKSKKAVILLSDGANNAATGKTLEQVRDYAIAQDIPIFTIYYVDPTYQLDAKPAIMQQMADETGGQDYYADTSTMESIFGQIRNMLGSKYTIHFASSHCSGEIPLRVQVNWNNGTDDLFGSDSRTLIIP